MNLEKFFISCLGSSETLQREIDGNVNLLDTMDKKSLLGLGVFFSVMPKSRKEEEIGIIDTDKILDLLSKERGDLYSVIIKHPRGKIWVGEQINDFKKRFL